MHRAIESSDIACAIDSIDRVEWEGVEAMEALMVVFVYSRSRGRHGDIQREEKSVQKAVREAGAAPSRMSCQTLKIIIKEHTPVAL
ncbi:hypothetical protein Drorol1_Dr00017802, partial [Drosera rotundifolia]